ncbi:ankyrin repeat containing protein [Ixodes scapularis]|uniref:Ankyrin repeat containing protein n=1 Tax=Ixodes scapularis TaxID=6945 RepID=B7PNX5_IXOSC|nr:ankyrin repeat containing protein [Ixodes scapularis]|eukprot:XP_002435467.1 ankyrin repeat containing protein [Ixodes scapularis]
MCNPPCVTHAGARCVANTFDGERCLYASLNVGIRNLLRDHKVVTSNTMRRDGYDQFLRRCLDDRQHCDITFRVGGEEVRAHRCILAARSEFFRDAFRTKWRGHNVVPVTHHLLEPENAWEVACVADVYLLPELRRQCGQLIGECLDEAGACSALKVARLLRLHRLEEQCIDFMARHLAQALFCNRSDYFRALIEDPFTEALSTGTSRAVPVISLNHVTPEVFKCVVQHVYGNTTTLEPENAWEVACVADVYLLPELRRQCGQLIGDCLDEAGACSALKVARLLRLHRLEEQCIDFMAKHLAQVVQRPEFREIVAQDASEVKLRQETDSISVIDDIRYHIAANARSCAEVELANQKLALIDALLSDMGLDA